MLKRGDVNTIKRGDLYFVDLSTGVGSEQMGKRPVVVIQNDIGNKYSPCVIIATITGQIQKAKLPTHVELKASSTGIAKDSVVLAEQVRTIDKSRLSRKIGELTEFEMGKINNAMMISIGLHKELAVC